VIDLNLLGRLRSRRLRRAQQRGDGLGRNAIGEAQEVSAAEAELEGGLLLHLDRDEAGVVDGASTVAAGPCRRLRHGYRLELLRPCRGA
jgi:hypothetical protein